MMAIYGPLQLILNVVYFMMIIHIIMSWLINFQVLNLHQPLVAQIWVGLNKLLEPIYQPDPPHFARYTPNGFGTIGGIHHCHFTAKLHPSRNFSCVSLIKTKTCNISIILGLSWSLTYETL